MPIIDTGRNDEAGAAVPVSRRAGIPSNTMWPATINILVTYGALQVFILYCIVLAWAEVYFRTKWRLHPSSRLATINMGQKLGGSGFALCQNLFVS